MRGGGGLPLAGWHAPVGPRLQMRREPLAEELAPNEVHSRRFPQPDVSGRIAVSGAATHVLKGNCDVRVFEIDHDNLDLGTGEGEGGDQ